MGRCLTISDPRPQPASTSLMDREIRRFRDDHPRSLALHERATGLAPRGRADELDGQVGRRRSRCSSRRAVGRPFHVTSTATTTSTSASATPARWPATARRRPSPRSNARCGRGITHMLPTEDAVWVGEELTRRFGAEATGSSPCPRPTPTASRPRLARHGHRPAEGGRPRPLLSRLGRRGDRDARRPTAGSSRARATSGPPVDPAETTRVVQFNDLAALEAPSPTAMSPSC